MSECAIRAPHETQIQCDKTFTNEPLNLPSSMTCGAKNECCLATPAEEHPGFARLCPARTTKWNVLHLSRHRHCFTFGSTWVCERRSATLFNRIHIHPSRDDHADAPPTPRHPSPALP